LHNGDKEGEPMFTINNLDHIVHDIVFEGFVFNHYEIFDNSSVFAYLHVDVIDQCGISTMSVTLNGALVTLHGDKFICRNHMQIKKITLTPQVKWEQGDLNICIRVNNLTLADVLSHENITFHFVHIYTIASFCKFLHDKFATTTIVILVISVQGEIDRGFDLTIADGETCYDIETISCNHFCFIFLGRMSHSFCAFKSWINFKALVFYQLYLRIIT